MTKEKPFYQYRIDLGDRTGEILSENPSEQWSRVAEFCEERGQTAVLYRRIVTDRSILPLLVNPERYIDLGDTVVGPWEVFAEMIGRP